MSSLNYRLLQKNKYETLIWVPVLLLFLFMTENITFFGFCSVEKLILKLHNL